MSLLTLASYANVISKLTLTLAEMITLSFWHFLFLLLMCYH